MNIGLARDWRDTQTFSPRHQSNYRRRLPALAFGAAAIANAVVIIWLWVYGKNVSGVHGWGDLWTSIGRLTGLLSAYLALIQVLLLARLPWLERGLGFDGLTVWHRRNGKICLYLVLAHVVFITIGYASMDQVNIPTEASRLLSDYPGMVAATVGTILMIAVVITSLVIVRRRIRYEAWYAVHLIVYAALALAWVHQIPTGNELTADPTAANYWTALYLVTLALLVWFRLLIPISQACRFQMRVAEVKSEGPGVVSLRIKGRNLGRLKAQAGQFFMWRFLSRGRWWEAHPFSLSEAPDGRTLRITVKASGDFTRRIGDIPVGTRVIAEGPFGVFTGAVRRREKLLFIAGGIGITPIRAMLEELRGDVSVIYRVAREEDLVFRAELERLVQLRGIAFTIVAGDHTHAEARDLLSTAHLRQLVPDIADRDVYLCGPPAMMRALERHVRDAGVTRRHIHTERFAL